MSLNRALIYDNQVRERLDYTGYIQRSFSFEEEREDSVELSNLRQLHESLVPYLDVSHLRELVAERGDIYAALRSDRPPAEVLALMDTLAALLRPPPGEKIRSPKDAAALLMVTMGHLDQEEMRTVLLDTKNRVQDIVLVYRGSVNTTHIRAGEVYKAAIRRNSAAIIVAHNHPSGDVTPSPEDGLVTCQLVQAGTILGVDCLDHLIIGRGNWCSMREKGIGFRES